MMRVFRSAFFWLYMALSLTAFWFAVIIPWLLITPFDRRRVFSHWYAYTWANHYVSLSPFWNVILEGREKFRDDTAYVVVSNHQSIADIMILFTLKKQFRWVAKHTVFFVPFLGWMMKMADYVSIKRGDKASREAMLDHCRRHLRIGNSIMIFPEGTRSHTGEMRPFKRGAFVLATEMNVPVLPIVLDNTYDALPRKSWVFQHSERKTFPIRVLDPIHPEDHDADPKALMAAVRAVMEDGLDQLREDYPHSSFVTDRARERAMKDKANKGGGEDPGATPAGDPEPLPE